MFIAGDLYEHNYIRQTTIEYINSLFKEIPKTKIFITPGNHDPFLKNSYYNTYNWNDNVYIFNSEIKKYEFPEVCIYGYGFDDFYCNDSKCEEIKIENKNKLNILITHASIDASKKLELQYNPIKEKDLTNLGFDYVALGHIHKKEIFNGNIVYPGSIISFGFDELGEHGILDVELIKNNKEINSENNLRINFIKLDERIFEEKAINISEINNKEELIEKINGLNLENKKMYKIILEGDRNFIINTSELCKLISQTNIIKIKNKTNIKCDLDKLSKEKNLTGMFVSEMLKNINEGKNDYRDALEIGLEILTEK